MSLSATDLSKLKKIIVLAQELLATVEPTSARSANGKKAQAGKRMRRSGKELAAFRKMLKAERKRGVRVQELAEKHGVSSAYVYQLGA